MRSNLSAQIVGASLALTVPFVRALSPCTEIADSYDFVIIGGGQAGLVLGGRLSEDSGHTILVLESGSNGDDYRERIGMRPTINPFAPPRSSLTRVLADTPADSYFDSLWTTPLNWAFYTVPQPNANDREIYWPRGKVLGGQHPSSFGIFANLTQQKYRQLCHQWIIHDPSW